ncbi:N-acetyltransferase esco2 [Mortierella claussenii]|nr:N-acetyltransferase esco2 [Mortierella claussenii]
MPYVRGQPEDERTHELYHRAVVGGIDYPGYKNEVVVARYNDPDVGTPPHQQQQQQQQNRRMSGHSSLLDAADSRIVLISMADTGKPASPMEKRKVKEILQVVNKELGSVDFDPEQLDACKVFLYISGKKKVVGCVVAERIKQGFEIMSMNDASCSSSLALQQRSEDSSSSLDVKEIQIPAPITGASATSSDPTGSAIFCSTVPKPAICGINRIWVSTHSRRRGVASRMLDAVRDRFIYACKLQCSDLAFSQPTGDGRALARRYLGTETFLVYVE